MKFIICGGGSGGHVSPAVAIYEELKKRNAEYEFCFVGRSGGRENDAYMKTGERLYTLNMRGINGKSPIKMLRGAFRAIGSLYEARRILSKETPSAVIATGGYVGWPMITVAKRLGIPTLIHESNAYPGLATRRSVGSADRILLNYADASRILSHPEKTSTVGNPIRQEFFSETRLASRRRLGLRDSDFFILSFGGSLGSEKMNDELMRLMKNHSSVSKEVKHLHATGRAYFEKADGRELKALRERGCITLPYIENMAEVMHAADVVIARAGAMTISEICAVGVASVLIPSPNVADDHQRKNADLMAQRGAAIVIDERDLTERRLADAVRELEVSRARRNQMGASAKKLAKKDAASKIADEILAIAK